MTHTVTLFASYAESFGRPQLDLHLGPGATVGDLVGSIRAHRDAGRLPDEPLVAVNQEYAGPDHPVRGSDEIAFFPPVTGG